MIIDDEAPCVELLLCDPEKSHQDAVATALGRRLGSGGFVEAVARETYRRPSTEIPWNTGALHPYLIDRKFNFRRRLVAANREDYETP